MNKHLRISESTNSFFQNTILSVIFVFKSNIYQIGSIFEKILAPILFPLVVIPDAIASLFAFYRFARAKNKNLGKTFDLIYAPIKAALVFTAVFAGLSLIFVQGLFLTAVGSSVVYHLGLSIFHLYHWRKSEKNSSIRSLHKNHLLNNLLSTTITGVVVAGIILTMVVAPYLAATVLATAGITAATLLMLTTIFAIYRNFKNPPLYPTITPSTSSENSEIFDHSASLSSTLSDATIPSSQQNQNSNYFHIECPTEKITSDFGKNILIINDIISNKLISLKSQREEKTAVWKEAVWSEKSKRQEKINLLEKFKLLLNSDEDIFKIKSDFLQLVKSTPNKAYQSFFKAKGSVESIQDGLEKHIGLQCRLN